jgi:hypothetical protein
LKRSGANNQNIIEFLYVKPKWYYIVNPHIEVGKNIFGRVLIAAALFKQEDINMTSMPQEFYDYKYREELKQK